MSWQQQPPVTVVLETVNDIGGAELLALAGQVGGAILGGLIAAAIALRVMKTTLAAQTQQHEEMLAEQKAERVEERQHAVELVQADRDYTRHALLTDALAEVLANRQALEATVLESGRAAPVLPTIGVASVVRLFFDGATSPDVFLGYLTEVKLWNLESEPMLLTIANPGAGSAKATYLNRTSSDLAKMKDGLLLVVEQAELALCEQLGLN